MGLLDNDLSPTNVHGIFLYESNPANTPEHDVCKELGIETVYGLGDKVQSSSWLIKNCRETD